MKNKDKVLAIGGWYCDKDCPDNPNPSKASHRFEDISKRPGIDRGEVLVTSQCIYCGGLIKDCPTIHL